MLFQLEAFRMLLQKIKVIHKQKHNASLSLKTNTESAASDQHITVPSCSQVSYLFYIPIKHLAVLSQCRKSKNTSSVKSLYYTARTQHWGYLPNLFHSFTKGKKIRPSENTIISQEKAALIWYTSTNHSTAIYSFPLQPKWLQFQEKAVATL